MKTRHIASLALFGTLGWTTACAPAISGTGGEESRSGVFFERGGTVLTGAALQDGPGSVLAAMSGKVPNFRATRQSGGCPLVSLRSNLTLGSLGNPHVYVDGTRATDTCVLESLSTVDVTRVEVYPQGFTTRPGYGRHAYGLILVFMRSG